MTGWSGGSNPSLATTGRWQAGNGSCLISRRCAGSSPARPTKEALTMTSKRAPSLMSTGRSAQWQSGGLLIRVRPRVRSPDGPHERRWRNWIAQPPSSGRVRVRLSGDARRVGVTVISPGPQPGAPRVQIRHASPWPHRPLARIRPFQGREDGSEPSRGFNLAWPNGRAADC